jgi:hypothetical protein
VEHDSTYIKFPSIGNFTTIITCTVTTATDGRVYGWIDQPKTRGTFDIAWNWVFLLFIHTYTMLCLNVPSSDETTWVIILRRLY